MTGIIEFVVALVSLLTPPIWWFVRLRPNGVLRAGVTVTAACIGGVLLVGIIGPSLQRHEDGGVQFVWQPSLEWWLRYLLIIPVVSAAIFAVLAATHLIMKRLGR